LVEDIYTAGKVREEDKQRRDGPGEFEPHRTEDARRVAIGRTAAIHDAEVQKRRVHREPNGARGDRDVPEQDLELPRQVRPHIGHDRKEVHGHAVPPAPPTRGNGGSIGWVAPATSVRLRHSRRNANKRPPNTAASVMMPPIRTAQSTLS